MADQFWLCQSRILTHNCSWNLCKLDLCTKIYKTFVVLTCLSWRDSPISHLVCWYMLMAGSEDEAGAWETEWRGHSTRGCNGGSRYHGRECGASEGFSSITVSLGHCFLLFTRLCTSRSVHTKIIYPFGRRIESILLLSRAIETLCFDWEFVFWGSARSHIAKNITYLPRTVAEDRSLWNEPSWFWFPFSPIRGFFVATCRTCKSGRPGDAWLGARELEKWGGWTWNSVGHACRGSQATLFVQRCRTWNFSSSWDRHFSISGITIHKHHIVSLKE